MLRKESCPLCSNGEFLELEGFDTKTDREDFTFLGLDYYPSRWSICCACGFVFQNPRPLPDAIIRLYQSGKYRSKRDYPEYYFQDKLVRTRTHLAWFQSVIGSSDELKILDIGAGFGCAVHAFREVGHEAEGIEIDPNLCKEAQRRYGISLINEDILGAKLPARSYDLIYSAHVHEHFEDFMAVNRTLLGALRPGGHILIVLPTFRCASYNGRGFFNVFHNSIFTAPTLQRMFENCDMTTLSLRYPLRGASPEVWGIARNAPPVRKTAPSDHASWIPREMRLGPWIYEPLYETRLGRKLIALIERFR